MKSYVGSSDLESARVILRKPPALFSTTGVGNRLFLGEAFLVVFAPLGCF